MGWSGGGARGSECLGHVRRECRFSLYPGTGLACLPFLSSTLPERGCGTCPLLGQTSLSVYLELKESDRLRQSVDALQDLFELTGFCFWRLLPPFAGRELLVIFFLLSFSFGTGFQSVVPFPMGTLFSVCRIGDFIPP